MTIGERIAVQVGKNSHNLPRAEELIRRGGAYANRDHVMQRRILGDIEPDFPFPRPSVLQVVSAVLEVTYLPAIIAALNAPSPLSRYLNHKVPDAYPTY